MTKSEFRSAPTLASFLPLVFDTGARWTEFSVYCNSCELLLDGEHLRGNVTHPFPKIFLVQALGLCPRCGTLTSCEYRLHEDMSMNGRSPRSGQWARWEPEYSWSLRRLWRHITQLFS